MNLRLFRAALVTVMVLGAPPGLLAADTDAGGEARFLSNVRQLTFEGRRSGEGYFSPDGKALIFQSEREPGNPFYQIHILDLASGDSHRVSPGIGKTTCAFFRPGTDEVLFASTHLDPEAKAKQKAELDFRAAGKERRYSWDYDEQMDIFAARRDGARLRRLTDAPGYDAEAAYSPDGKKIVFCSLRDAYPTNKLAPEQLKRLETDPAWFGEVYIMNADGSDQRRLTHSPGCDGGPFFSPDGERIVWRHFEGCASPLRRALTDCRSFPRTASSFVGLRAARPTASRNSSWRIGMTERPCRRSRPPPRLATRASRLPRARAPGKCPSGARSVLAGRRRRRSRRCVPRSVIWLRTRLAAE